MIRVLNRIDKKLETMIDAMLESNELMRKLTKQLEIISLPPDMVLWSKTRKKWEKKPIRVSGNLKKSYFTENIDKEKKK